MGFRMLTGGVNPPAGRRERAAKEAPAAKHGKAVVNERGGSQYEE